MEWKQNGLSVWTSPWGNKQLRRSVDIFCLCQRGVNVWESPERLSVPQRKRRMVHIDEDIYIDVEKEEERGLLGKNPQRIRRRFRRCCNNTGWLLIRHIDQRVHGMRDTVLNTFKIKHTPFSFITSCVCVSVSCCGDASGFEAWISAGISLCLHLW